MTSKEALAKLKLKQPPATGQENYQYLTSVWQQVNMRTFEDFLRWCKNEVVVLTLETMQKMLDFYHKNGIVLLKLGCTLPNPPNVHESTTAKIYPFRDNDKDLLEELRENMVGGPSIVFARKTVVDETLIRDSTNVQVHCRN